ncbi:MAG TPA: hypothetical protein VLG09_01645 [Candidatus Saccharimonadales bacterium]|jgi:hypothetical protein|nr:hypothetical protein [Candidatus Saccharimonadales bacterium]
MDSKRLTAAITVTSACLLVGLMVTGVMPIMVIDWRGGTLLLLTFGGIMLTTIGPTSLPDSGLWSIISIALTIVAIVAGIINLTFGGRELFLFLFFCLMGFWLVMFATALSHHYRHR